MSLDKLSPAQVKSTFTATGLFPLNKDAIDKTKLIADDFSSSNTTEADVSVTPSLVLQCWSDDSDDEHHPSNGNLTSAIFQISSSVYKLFQLPHECGNSPNLQEHLCF